MQILSADQIRAADAFTIANEPISSIDLMERAASRSTAKMWKLSEEGVIPVLKERGVCVLCGMGNNGGDGLVMARQLSLEQVEVHVYLVKFSEKGSTDLEKNRERLSGTSVKVFELSEEDHEFEIDDRVVVDALFGSGLARPIDGWIAKVVSNVNKNSSCTISIDIPSGLFGDDQVANGAVCIEADHTLTFELPKLAMLLPQNHSRIGELHIIPIGLDQQFIRSQETAYTLIDLAMVRSVVRPRSRTAHKGSFGHALIAAGSEGKMGAAVLAANACLRSGAGLTTVHIPRVGVPVLQTAVPEAMCSADQDGFIITALPDLAGFSSIGIGPGIGTSGETASVLKLLIQNSASAIVLDADAINILADNPTWLAFLPTGSILTPHIKEFERIAGKFDDDLKRIHAARALAQKNSSIVVLKSAFTAICAPDGQVFFNRNGNPGMATGGSGDVLTGMITGLLAQGYTSLEAAILGVYWHGCAGDLAALEHGQPSMKAGDIIEHLGRAFKKMLKQ